MLINDDECCIYNIDGLTFKINPQNGACMNHYCPFCGQGTLHFLGMNDMLLSCPPQYKIDIACYNPRCPGHHNLSGIIVNGEFNTDSQLAMTSTIKKLIEAKSNQQKEKMNTNEIEINGIKYIRADKITIPTPSFKGMEYKIVRGIHSGVFAGYIESRNGHEVIMLQARRLWYWDGAASLSELAMRGVSRPKTCKFPCEISKVQILDAVEILDVTEQAKKSIDEVPIWTA